MEPYGAAYGKLLERFRRAPSVQVLECSSSLNAVPLAKQSQACIILCHAATNDQIVKHVTLLKLIKDLIDSDQCRVILTTQFRQPALEERLRMYGFSEIIPEPIHEKSLLFKMERHIKQLQSAKSNARASHANSPSHAGSDAGASHSAHSPSHSAYANEPQIKKTAPLELKSDCWIAREGSVKRIGERWMIKMAGPGPVAGRWAEKNSAKSGRNKTWKWIPHPTLGEQFVPGPGEWVFQGQRIPEFQDELWWFVGSAPVLAFHSEGKLLGEKFAGEQDGSIRIAEDSPNALALLPKIEATLNQVIRSVTDNRKSEEHTTEEGSSLDGAESASGLAASTLAQEWGGKVIVGEPLAIESDFWLFESRVPRKAKGKWSVKVFGPGPSSGRWIPASSQKPGVTDSLWKWVPSTEAAEKLVRRPGEWQFRGSAPRHEGKLWHFAGTAPDLSFVEGGKSVASKFQPIKGGDMQIAEDSALAKSRQSMIEKIEEEAKAGEKEEDSKDKGRDEPETIELRSKSRRAQVSEEAGLASVSDRRKERRETDASFDADSAGTESDEDQIEQHKKRRSSEQSENSDSSVSGSSGRDEEGEESRQGAEDSGHFSSGQVSSGQVSSDQAEGDQEEAARRSSAKSAAAGVAKAASARASLSDEEASEEIKAGEEKTNAGEVVADEGRHAAESGPGEIERAESGASEDSESVQASGKRAEQDAVEAEKAQDAEDAEDAEGAEARSSDEESSSADARTAEPDEASLNLEQARTETGEQTIEQEQKPSFQEVVMQRLQESTENLPEGTLDAFKQVSEVLAVKAEAKAEQEAQAQPQAQEVPKEPSERVKALFPPGPSLGPLAIGFLVSELVCKREMSLKDLSSKFCKYLSASCGGLDVELWYSRSGSWKCAATSDGSEGVQAPHLEGLTAGVRHVDETLLIGPIEGESQKLLGAVVISGEGTKGVQTEYVSDVNGMLVGLMTSWSKSDAP